MIIEHLKKLNFSLDPSTTLLDIDYDYFSTNSPLVDDLIKRFKNKQQVKKVISIFNEENYCLSNTKNLTTEQNQFVEFYKLSSFQNSRAEAKEFWISRILQSHLRECFHGKKKTNKEFLECSEISSKLWCKGEEDSIKLQLIFKKYMDYMIEEEEEDSVDDINDLLDEANSASSLGEFSKSFSEIRENVLKLKQFLIEFGLKSSPKLISLSQSLNCGHTPKHLIEFIKFEIYSLLNDIFIK